MSKKNVKRFAIGTAVAGVAGYVAGILTAPKSGKQTREDIKSTVDKNLNEAEKQLKAMHTELNKLLDEAKKHGGKLSGQAQKELDVLLEKTKDTKEKAREMISAIHEGDAEDKDLASAIKQANAAIDNLKTYLKK